MKKFLFVLLLVLLAGGTHAAGPAAVDSDPVQMFLNSLPWRNIGPANMGGRIDDFAVVESAPHIAYVGTASGGIWKTVNSGTTWQSMFQDQAVSSIGDLALAPSNPSILWVGTGEANNRQSSTWGNGVYRSTDGGSTFRHMGLEDTHHIGRVVVHPTNPDIVYVAAVGHLWGANEQRGLFRTTNGGTSWDKVLYLNADTGVIDVAMDPASPNILYAAAYQRRRTAFGFNGGGPASGLFRSTDGGDSWQRLTNGLPDGATGRIGIDVYRSDPRIVYAVVQNADGGTFRSEDRGETWTRMSETNPRPMYYSQIRIDPNNDQRIWVLGASMAYSEDGGRTFETDHVTRIHGDYHAMWINPSNSDHILLGSDGGIHYSYDRGSTWEFVNTIPLGQFYEIGLDMQEPYNIYGGLQDNGSWGGPVRTLTRLGISNEDWVRVGGGDGFYARVIPNDPSTVYVESQNGSISRVNLKSGESKRIRPEPPEGEDRYRFDWNSPMLISPHDPDTIYYGGNRLFKSTNRGDGWTHTDDLSRNQDRTSMEIMGEVPLRGTTLSANDGISSFGQIISITESAVEQGVLYVGTDDGNLQVSRDDGQSWKNISANVESVPDGTYVSRVVASRFEAGRVYATFDGHRSDDFRPHIGVSEDYGESWRMITQGLAAGHTVNVIREHHRNPNLLFTGTEFGAYVSLTRGEQWYRLGGDFPTVPVDDIAIHPRDNDLVVATHGRSIWVADDITALEELSEAAMQSEIHLFSPRRATSYRIRNHKGSTGHKLFVADNPPAGALLHFSCAQSQKEVLFEIADSGGSTVRSLQAQCEPGYNRLTWDLRHDSPVPEQAAGQQGGFRRFRIQGPRVLPGSYTITARVGQSSSVQSIEVAEDPRLGLTTDDLKAHHDAMLLISALISRGQQLQGRATSLTEQLQKIDQAIENADKTSSEVETALDSVRQKLREMGLVRRPAGQGGQGGFRRRGGAGNPALNQATTVYRQLGGYTERPSASQLESIASAETKLDELESSFEAFLDGELKELNDRLRRNSPTFQLKP